jgi:hypothetical protein
MDTHERHYMQMCAQLRPQAVFSPRNNPRCSWSRKVNEPQSRKGQGRQCTYSVTLRRVRVTTVIVVKHT